jgi:hypothetical protein
VHPVLRRTADFILGWTIGSYIGRRMAERRKRVGAWTTPRVRGYLMVAVPFMGSLALSVHWPQQELLIIGGALFVGEGARRAYMAGYARRHQDV